MKDKTNVFWTHGAIYFVKFNIIFVLWQNSSGKECLQDTTVMEATKHFRSTFKLHTLICTFHQLIYHENCLNMFNAFLLYGNAYSNTHQEMLFILISYCCVNQFLFISLSFVQSVLFIHKLCCCPQTWLLNTSHYGDHPHVVGTSCRGDHHPKIANQQKPSQRKAIPQAPSSDRPPTQGCRSPWLWYSQSSRQGWEQEVQQWWRWCHWR